MVELNKLLASESVIGFEHVQINATVTGGKTDSRDICAGDIYFALKGSRSDGHDFIPDISGRAVVSVVNKDYKNAGKNPVIYSENVEKTLCEFAMLWRKNHKATVIGITGSNGKTTTKEMLVKILSDKFRLISTFKNYNNQIGVPLTLFKIKDDTEVAVVELGTNSIGEIRYLSRISDPDLAVITNIGEAHLEELKNKEGVYKEKTDLFEYVFVKRGKILVNTDDEYLREWKKGDIVTYGLNGKTDHGFNKIRMSEDGYPEFEFKGHAIKMKTPGMLNVKNALAAAAVAVELGVSSQEVASGLSLYEPSEKRYELIKYKNSSVLVDCYNANPTSTAAFLNDLTNIGTNFMVVLGDMYELGEMSKEFHSRIIDLASGKGFRRILLTGKEMKKALGEKPVQNSVKYFEKFEELKAEFEKEAEKGAYIAVKGSRKMELEKLLDGDYASKS